MKYLFNYDDCHYTDIIEKVTTEVFENEITALPLEACLIHSATITEDDFERRECANYLEATTSLPKMGGTRFISFTIHSGGTKIRA